MGVCRDRSVSLAVLLLLSCVPVLRTCLLGDGVLRTVRPEPHTLGHDGVPAWWADERVDAIFAPVDRIDVVNGELAPDWPAEGSLLRHRTVRRYSTTTGHQGGQHTPCPEAADERQLPPDGQVERFRGHWFENAHGGGGGGGGYIIFGQHDPAALLPGYACLLDPAGTYLFVQVRQPLRPQDDRLLLQAALHRIWSERGVFRVFVRLWAGKLVTYDPFQPPAPGSPTTAYGALVALDSGDQLPHVPAANFHGYPLRVEVFRSVYSNPIAAAAAAAAPPETERSAADTATTVDYRGPDVTVRDALQRALNVTVVHVRSDKDLFGDRLPNGSFSGALGRLVRREVDIVFTGFFVKDYFTRDVEFTASVYSDAVCCLVQKASRIPEALLPLYIFPGDIWALLALLGLLCALVWAALRCSVRRLYRMRRLPPWSRRHRLAVLFNLAPSLRRAPAARHAAQLLVDAFLLLLSAPYRRFTRSGIERLFLAGLLLVSLIFVSLYQSGLASVFVDPLYHPDINTLQQLEASGMPIPVKYRGFLDDVFPLNYSRLMDALRSRMEVLRVQESMLTRVARLGTVATVTRRSTLALDNAIYMMTRQLHLVSECPRTYNIAYVTPHRFVLGERLNRVLLRLAGGGLVDHWIDGARYEWTLRDRPLVQRMLQSDFKVLTVLDMQFAFYALIIGLTLSVATIAAELALLFIHREAPRARPSPATNPTLTPHPHPTPAPAPVIGKATEIQRSLLIE